jgi:tetratricopeptide (TPR) repeat protein
MYNLIISGGLAVVTFAALMFLAGTGLWWAWFMIGLAVFAVAFLVLARIITKRLEAIMEPAMKDIQAQRFEVGIRKLQEAMKYGKWQIYVTGQINATIGMVYYVKRDFATAFPYLEKGFFKNWVTMGMLAISYMKRNKPDKMKETFEKAVLATPKESLLWSLYAYCLNETGSTEKAKEVLEKGLKKLPGDEKLKQNLELLNEGKKMKMKAYGDVWLQFHLESLGTIQKQQMAAMGGRRRVVRR